MLHLVLNEALSGQKPVNALQDEAPKAAASVCLFYRTEDLDCRIGITWALTAGPFTHQLSFLPVNPVM